MRRILVTAVAVGVTVAGATVAANAWAGSPHEQSKITWRPCADEALKTRKAECGLLTVPRDHDRPDGPAIKLALSRIKHTAKNYQGVMLVNPGGPGGSGLIMAALGAQVPDGAGAEYDWIGFDPRGVGASQPALSCDAGYGKAERPAYVPRAAAIERAWLTRTKRYAAACDKAGGPLLDHLRTIDNVRDLDLIRRALGAEQINFYGFSYGTYLGQVYATKYPQHVRRMVLDGNVHPGRVWYQANQDQNLAFEKSIKVFFAWVAKHHKVYRLGATATAVEKLYYRALDRKEIGPADLTDVFLQAGYYTFGWDKVASAFSAYVVKKDPAPLRKLSAETEAGAGAGDNAYAMYLATQCTDAPWPASWGTWRTDNWRTHARAPFETWGNAWFNAPCRTWGAKAGTPVAVDGGKAPPVLLISETLDAATPFAGSLEVRKRFPRAALVEGVGGTTHSGSLFGNKCVDGAVAAYLRTGALPPRVKANMSDRKCTPLAPPQPGSSAQQREAADPLSRAALQGAIGRP